ncbi:hypothetical protein BRM44_00025, partial [Xanthomonas oryzae pv. oryzae]
MPHTRHAQRARVQAHGEGRWKKAKTSVRQARSDADVSARHIARTAHAVTDAADGIGTKRGSA